jgi:DNA-binding transcriptional MerR regulator
VGRVERSLLGIGALAQASGLSVSALRFYDGAGVLVPASVDPYNGYRRYSRDQVDDARIVARLRRVGVALPDLRRILAWRVDPMAAAAVLDEHLLRLELGLSDARRELSTVRTLIDPKENVMPSTASVHVNAPELADALYAVRFAVGSDPGMPMLCGVLFEIDEVVTLVATDRYRLAVATVPGATTGSASAIVPVALVDALIRLLADHVGEVEIEVGNAVSFIVGGTTIRGDALDLVFPDYRRLTALSPKTQVFVEAAGLRSAVMGSSGRTMVREQDGISYDVVELVFGDGAVSVVGPDACTGAGVGLNREFLLEALTAGGEGQLVLELDGPIAPLAIRPVTGDRFSLLMPTRLP